jgi:sugar/nucleoside kinase (ribokinase family)
VTRLAAGDEAGGAVTDAARAAGAGQAAGADARADAETGAAGRSPGRRPPGSGLLVVGEVVTDVVARHRDPLAPATDTAARIELLPGGAGANVACWAVTAAGGPHPGPGGAHADGSGRCASGADASGTDTSGTDARRADASRTDTSRASASGPPAGDPDGGDWDAADPDAGDPDASGPPAAGASAAAGPYRLTRGADTAPPAPSGASGAGPLSVRLLAKAGADTARWHRAALRRAGVEPVLRVDPDLPTAVVIALVDAAAERTLVTDSGAALRLGPRDWDAALLDGVGHVHVSGYLLFSAPGRALAAVVGEAARARGVPVSVDPASAGFLRASGVARFLESVAGVDLLLPNAAEAAALCGRPETTDAATDQDGAADDAAELSARLPGTTVVVTLGAMGALAARGGRVVARVPGLPVTPVDTTGAGDAFTGALLAARLTGAPLPAALAAACATAATAVTVVGGRPAAARLGLDDGVTAPA